MAADWDNLFKYCTPKYVYIRDAKLGIMKFFFMGMIFVYVIAYEIMYSCSHLITHHAQGFGTVDMRQPIEKCDEDDMSCLDRFHNIAELPYCLQSTGESASLRELGKTKKSDPEEDGDDGKKEDEVGDTITKPRMCQYLDHNRLEFNTNPSEAFIPTHYQRSVQTIDPKCYNPDTDKVEKGADATKYRCKNIWKTTKVTDYYIADIESFKLSMKHSFSSPDIFMSGISVDYQGFFAACPNNHPKDVRTECKRVKIPNTSGATAPEDLAGLTTSEELGIETLTGTKRGEDEISLRDLLKTTPVALDNSLKTPLDAKLPGALGHSGESLREVGGMLLLDVNYANNALMRPGFHGLLGSSLAVKPVTYEYRPYFIPTRENKVQQTLMTSDDAQQRTVDTWYGITIKFQFNGQLVKFSWQGLLKCLTTALVLLSSATALVAACASYVMPLKEKYGLLMYQMSEDFTDYHNLRTCVQEEKNGAQAWADLKTDRPGGNMLLEKLSANGEWVNELTNEELVQYLCLSEMRLNRLDGQDPKITFVEANEKNPINAAIGRLEEKYYKGTALGKDDKLMKTMAFADRLVQTGAE